MKEVTAEKFSFNHFIEQLSQHQRKALTYGGLFAALAVVVGAIVLIPIDSDSVLRLRKALQFLAFLGIGIAYATQYPKRLYFFSDRGFSGGLLYSIFLTLVIYVLLFALYLLIDRALLLTALGSACAFLLPFIVSQAWESYDTVTENPYSLWYPTGPVDETDVVFLNGLPIKVKLAQSPYDQTEQTYASSAPLDMKLGDFFNHFILQKNKGKRPVIELTNESKTTSGWEFYTEAYGGLQKRPLNPRETILDNKLEKGAVIIARRGHKALLENGEQRLLSLTEPT